MERNTILAVVLSALVLFSYQSLFVAPKRAELLKDSQVPAAQSVSPISSIPQASAPQSSPETTSAINKTADYEIKTNEANISYTNVGGTLHNIDFIGNNKFPITDVLSIGGFENAQFIGQKSGNKIVSLVYSDKNWQITKIYEMEDNDFLKVRMEIKNMSEISILTNFNFKTFEIDESGIDLNQASRESALFEYSLFER